MTAGKQFDKWEVFFISTLYRNETENVQRRTSRGGATQVVVKPKIVTDDNEFISGVDIVDQCMIYYACGTSIYSIDC